MTTDVNKTNMLREIKEQPQILRETIDSTIKQTENLRELLETRWKRNSGSLFLIGCGTSYHVAIAGKHALRDFAGISSTACPASEFRDFESRRKGDILIAISQSGETGDVLTAVRQALKDNCTILAITNEGKSSLANLSEATIVTRAGKELAVPMTKTYTALLAAIFTFAKTFQRTGKRDPTLQKIPAVVEDTIRTSERKIREIADMIKENRSIFLLGRGPNYATALEASLKLKEAALVHAEAFPSSEFRHGPKALLESGTSLVAFTSSSEYDDTTIRLLEEVKSTGARIFSVGDRDGSTIEIPTLSYNLTPIPNIVPLQMLAAYIAVRKGINPDNPRNLVKTTTAT